VSTLVVCAGSALVLPPSTIDGVSGGAAPARASLDRGAGRSGSDNAIAAPGGGVSIAIDGVRHADLVSPLRDEDQAIVRRAASSIARIEPGICASRQPARHSMRAPPLEDDDSSDGDGDGDGDDDDDDADVLRMARTDTVAPADINQLSTAEPDEDRPADALPTLDAVLPLSFVFDVQSLRAPPQ
jgi:hypothetical protein